MAKDEVDDSMPDKDVAKDFYAKYEPKEILGRGVSSTVRRVIEKESGKEFAAKIIDVSGDDDDPDGFAIREATVREVNVLRMVAGHPYIIELHEVFESSTFIFLVFELCKHGELFDYLTSVVTLTEKKTKFMMRQLFEAVENIHDKNIVHRDLKPENILLDDNMNIKLTDFGFARVLQPEEVLYDLYGTPNYMAPEVLKCGMIQGAKGYALPCDVWACGVIMYTVLVGCPPFWHRKQMVMLRNIMEGKYSFSSPEWDDITETPKDLISKLLVVDPAQRITIKEALNHEFFQILTSQGRKYRGKRLFQFAVFCIRCLIRIKRLRETPEPLSVQKARIDPYKIRALRKVVDACAFRVYGHWVKKGEAQNRAALFENTPKRELRERQLISDA